VRLPPAQKAHDSHRSQAKKDKIIAYPQEGVPLVLREKKKERRCREKKEDAKKKWGTGCPPETVASPTK